MLDQFEERNKLHCSQAEAHQNHAEEPHCHVHNPGGVTLFPPESDQTRQSIEGHHQKVVVVELRVAGQALYPQAKSSQQEPGNEIHGFVMPRFCLADDQFYGRQEQRQPGGSSDYHGEDHAGDEKAAEGIGDARDDASEPPDANRAQVDIHESAREPEL